MKRLIDITDDYFCNSSAEDLVDMDRMYAIIDTVTDLFHKFNGSMYWHDVEEFQYDFDREHNGGEQELRQRLSQLFPGGEDD